MTRFSVTRLNSHGDGVAQTETGLVAIPFTLPGETVTAARQKDRAVLVALIEASPERIAPACRHFGECGGCALQHWQDSAYRDWKRSLVANAMKSAGVDADIGELVSFPPASRRRLVLTAARAGAGMALGFQRAMSHDLVEISECAVADPRLIAAFPALHRIAGLISKTEKPFKLTVAVTDAGLDIAAEGSGKLEGQSRQSAVDAVNALGLARLTIDGELVIERVKPVIMAGNVAIGLPPGGFMQAVAAAEAVMAALVQTHFGKAKRVADLFAGSGAFALRLASTALVHAVESDAAALAALDRAFRFAGAIKTVTHEKRDLYRRPLLVRELDGFDAVVFDPPRAGAEEQVRLLAKSKVRKVAAVSCNPLTLARDLKILVSGGYAIRSITPIDQFIWSPHVEAVALLEKR